MLGKFVRVMAEIWLVSSFNKSSIMCLVSDLGDIRRKRISYLLGINRLFDKFYKLKEKFL